MFGIMVSLGYPPDILTRKHIIRVIPTSFVLGIFVVVKPYLDVLVHFTTKIPSHSQVITKLVPLDLRGGLSKPLGGVVVTHVQLIVSYFRPYTCNF